MSKGQKFFICKHCGNLIGLIFNKGIPIVCCGENMQELVANTTDASQEKHVPVISILGSTVKVEVGSTLHPMTDEHYIEWIYIETRNGGQRKSLSPSDAPIADFALIDDEVVSAFAYCNLHGLWSATV